MNMDKDIDKSVEMVVEQDMQTVMDMGMMCCGGLWPLVYAAGIIGLAWMGVAFINRKRY